jgi:hypothetical protein
MGLTQNGYHSQLQKARKGWHSANIPRGLFIATSHSSTEPTLLKADPPQRIHQPALRPPYDSPSCASRHQSSPTRTTLTASARVKTHQAAPSSRPIKRLIIPSESTYKCATADEKKCSPRLAHSRAMRLPTATGLRTTQWLLLW